MMEKKEIKDIAENLDLGMRCFINTKTKEIKFLPDYNKFPEMDAEFFEDDNQEIKNNFDDYVQIEGMDSHESFKIMEDFIETVENDALVERLNYALNGRKPFRNFKFTIDSSGPYRERWFQFKEQKLIEWVEDQLKRKGLLQTTKQHNG